MESKEKKRKRAATATAVVLVAAIALTGTYAWQSIRQSTTNKKTVEFEAGGRLHDDFDGKKKSVYVENYMDPEAEDSAPIFVRIRLLEYMETGSDAGKNREELNENRGDVTSIGENAEISDVTTWWIHKPGDQNDPFHEFWKWGLGGSTSYLPTFNKDNTSLVPDVNGTYEGTVVGDKEYFDDYVDYSSPDTPNEVVDDADYGNGTIIRENHEVQKTQNADVITMEQWITEKDSAPGKYWVWDTDGWAYWAEPLQPGEATGLLLNSITPLDAQRCYYAVHVVNQQASAGDWGEKGENEDGTGNGATGFYVDGLTDNALTLLNTINVVPKDTAEE